ncbi:flagellar protein FlaG [Vagococcus sp. DIV0080]|uniref:Flagellar protein FlaG n=1 Tax=Candidatus Vagococcus giribetii TaxID=2230876 RepID=A0ABS3HUB1_9ENTE|nr:flagellar protein FlaG [Vagococcus sp. DIV0080]MBO0476945.1 flagellar protein FlaG [Vagococcus sp. DIV0080]
MVDIPQIHSYEPQNVIEKIEQAGKISEHLENEPHQENLKRQKKKSESVQSHKYSEDNIKQIIAISNRQLAEKDVKMEFEIYQLTNRLIIRLINTTNDEIVKEISSEELLDSIVSNWGIIGNLIDKEG